ncbi:MAG: TIGR03067 domain-containing protein [Planctomycetes bacterium]|nr:TIGR03067 domain-containing protein [Planctomycetota bacterium]
MRLMLSAFALLVFAWGFAQAGDDDTDLRSLQGTWLVVSLTEKDKKVPTAETEVLEFRVVKDTFTVTEKGKVIAKYQFKLDATKTPKAIDVTHLIGEDKGKKNLGVYGIDKLFLRICLDETGKQRPTAFTGAEARRCSVIVLKRKRS